MVTVAEFDHCAEVGCMSVSTKIHRIEGAGTGSEAGVWSSVSYPVGHPLYKLYWYIHSNKYMLTSISNNRSRFTQFTKLSVTYLGSRFIPPWVMSSGLPLPLQLLAGTYAGLVGVSGVGSAQLPGRSALIQIVLVHIFILLNFY